MNVVVIGSGAAAISAVETIRDVDKDSRVTIISLEKEIYSPCLLPYYLSGDINEERLLFRDPHFYDRMRVDPIFKKATKVVPAQNSVLLEDGGKVKYDKLLIATGSSPLSPKVEGIDKNGVFFFNTIEDARKIVGWSEGTTRAVVIGAGFIGMEAAISLRNKGIDVSLVEMQDRVLPELLDKEIAEVAQKQLKRNGIKVILESHVSELVGNGKVDGAILARRRIECDMALITAGIAPNIDLVKGTDINLGTGIIVDENMKTSVGNVYAAGDVAEAIDIVTKERRINPIWPNAVKQGRVAASNLLGIESKYEGSDRMNVIDIFGMPIVCIGHKVADSEEISAPGKKITLKDNRIVGLTFVGNIKSAGVILSLIRKGVDISRMKDIILKDEFGYGKVAKYESAAIAFGLERVVRPDRGVIARDISA